MAPLLQVADVRAVLDELRASCAVREWCVGMIEWEDPARPFALECGALSVSFGGVLQQDKQWVTRIQALREFMGILGLLSCCRLAEPVETFFGQLLPTIVSSPKLLLVNDSASMSRFVIQCGAFNLTSVDAFIAFYRTLLGWLPLSDSTETSQLYQRALGVLEPFVDAVQRQQRQVLVNANIPQFASIPPAVFDDLNSFFDEVYSKPSTIGPFAVKVVGISLAEMLLFSRCMNECGKFWRLDQFSIVHCNSLSLCSLATCPDPPTDQWNHDRAVMATLLTERLDGRWPSNKLRVTYGRGPLTWQASFLCSLIRSSRAEHIVQNMTFVDVQGEAQVLWVMFGLFYHSLSIRPTINMLELLLYDFGLDPIHLRSVAALFNSRRPGEILVNTLEDLANSQNAEFVETGTTAHLVSTTFDFLWHLGAPRDSDRPQGPVQVHYDGPPELEVLVMLPRFVGVLIHGYGFGWVNRSVVSLIAQTDVFEVNASTSVVNLRLLIAKPSTVHELLQSIGTNLRTLHLLDPVPGSPDDRPQLRNIPRCCPQLTTLKVENPDLTDLMQAYDDGECRVETLVCTFKKCSSYTAAMTEFPPEAQRNAIVGLKPLVNAVNQTNHRVLEYLQNLRISISASVPSVPTEDVTALTEVLRSLLQRPGPKRIHVCGSAAPLHLFELVSQYHGSILIDHHPVFGLLSVSLSDADVGKIVAMFDCAVFEVIHAFVGPNREVRLNNCNGDQNSQPFLH